MIQYIELYTIRYKNILIALLGLVFLVLPLFVSAQTVSNNNTSSAPNCGTLLSGGINNFKDVIDLGTCLIRNSIVPLLTGIAVVMFMYGMISYFLNPNSVKEREDAKKYMLWALIGLFVLYSVTGILQIIRNTFGVSGGFTPLLPEVQ